MYIEFSFNIIKKCKVTKYLLSYFKIEKLQKIIKLNLKYR